MELLTRVYEEEALLTLEAGLVRMSYAPNFNMISEPIYSDHLPIHTPSPLVLGVRGFIWKNKSL